MRSKAKKTKKTKKTWSEIYRLDVSMRPKAREDAKYDPHARVTA